MIMPSLIMIPICVIVSVVNNYTFSLVRMAISDIIILIQMIIGYNVGALEKAYAGKRSAHSCFIATIYLFISLIISIFISKLY